ncbi:MAG: NUDIX domain-containing protein [Cyclobacteriaceae bacterium]
MENFTNPWKKLSSRPIYDNPWINVEEHQVLNPAGKPGIYGKVHFKNKAIGIIPLNERDETWLVGQYRYTLDAWSWEIPEGGGALSTDPLISAKRELKEETGLEAEKWTKIGRAHLSNSVSDEEGILFIAENLSEGKSEREDTEADMKIKRVHLKEAVDMVVKGEITDSLSVIGLLMVARVKGY